MSALPRACFEIETGEFIRTVISPMGVSVDIWRLTDAFAVRLYAVCVNGEVIHECDDEWDARFWITRNI